MALINLYNLDQHISVNSDLQHIFRKLGTELTIDSISGHSWVMGRQRASVSLVENNIYEIIEKELWKPFYDTYADKLKPFDGFVCCYPPVFAMLFKQFTDKRVLVNIPIRYDWPYTDKPEQLERLNEFLCSDSVIVTANNKLDKAYFEDRTGGVKECIYIPSLCEYTGMKYASKRDEFLLYDGTRNWQIENTVNRYDAEMQGHKWSDVQAFKGIIHIPYQVSTMSFYEAYSACIPLFYPSKRFLLKMYDNGRKVLDQCFWSREQHGKYGFETMPDVLELADYYSDTFPHVILFDSIYDLEEKMYDDKLIEWTSMQMEAQNQWNRASAYKSWESVLEKLKR